MRDMSRRDLLKSMAYSALALPILGKSKIEKIPPALENSPGEPALQPIPPKGLHRERLDRLMRGAGIDAILASTRNNIGYLTDMYLGMGDRFTAIQNYAIYAQGNDIISFVGELDWCMGELLDCDLDHVSLHLSEGAWYNSFSGPLSERDQRMVALMKRRYSPGLDPGDTGALIEAIQEKKLENAVVGVEDKMSMKALDAIKKEFPKMHIRNASSLLESTRSVKNRHELDSMIQATKISARALDETHQALTAGMSSEEIRDLLAKNLRKMGGSNPGVSADIGVYPNRQLGYKLKRGDLVVLDAVNSVNHRFGDLGMSRVFEGKASDKLSNSHKALSNGIQACREAARPGITITDLCNAILKGIQDYYPGYSRSRNVFGHSVGIECPEIPILTLGNQTVLEPGMVLNPDILVYDYGSYMLLVENTILVTEKGCELVTDIERTLSA